MSIGFSCMSSLEPDEAQSEIARVNQLHRDVMRYFWVSNVHQAKERSRDEASEFKFNANSIFMVEWNKEGGSEFIPLIPNILYETFGRDKLLVFDLNRELIR
jgi:hypothetical protein